MILKELKYSSFSYKFKTPFQTSSAVIKERKGFLISIKDENGNTAVSECSPLPGFSAESYEEVKRFLATSLNNLVSFEIKEVAELISKSVAEITQFPSVRFALEQALIGLASLRDKSFLKTNFGTSKNTVPVNAVIGFDKPEKVLAKVNSKFQKGYRTFKIKVGREEFSDDYAVVKLIRKKFAGGIAIRLDANGMWDVDRALDYLAKLSAFDIEYIEEPCKNLSCLIKLAEHSPIPIAVDESIRTFDNAKEVLKLGRVDYLVVKPTVLGGIIETAGLIKLAEELRKKVIISSSFETPVGKSGLVFLAALASHNLAHGLDTADMLTDVTITDPYKVQDANISFDTVTFPPNYETGDAS